MTHIKYYWKVIVVKSVF